MQSYIANREPSNNDDSRLSTRSRSRTGTSFTSLVFETNASTDSAIRASKKRHKGKGLFLKCKIKFIGMLARF